jgi:hypothetical protein
MLASFHTSSRERLQQAQMFLGNAQAAKPTIEVFNVPNIRQIRW